MILVLFAKRTLVLWDCFAFGVHAKHVRQFAPCAVPILGTLPILGTFPGAGFPSQNAAEDV
ncbi:MAG: hypothetical protein Q8L87_20155, partial [Anaerolineales bacterium]|nr:hypothetical protein [Anaerolineales bacterium]